MDTLSNLKGSTKIGEELQSLSGLKAFGQIAERNHWSDVVLVSSFQDK